MQFDIADINLSFKGLNRMGQAEHAGAESHSRPV